MICGTMIILFMIWDVRYEIRELWRAIDKLSDEVSVAQSERRNNRERMDGMLVGLHEMQIEVEEIHRTREALRGAVMGLRPPPPPDGNAGVGHAR